jgi:hypothetical protein
MDFLKPNLDPDNYRLYFIFYIIIIVVGLVALYHPFIFSDSMLGGGDMLVTGVFFRTFLVEHVWTHGNIPMWNPFMFCGLPYVDAFHGDIFYPLSFLKYLGPVYRMLGFVLILHIFLAGVFMYLTARQLSLSRLGATMAGIAYMFSGWLSSLIVPGHDGKMFVTALFPLTIFFLDRAFSRNRFLNFTMLGVVIGLIILTPHPQLAYYTLLVLCAYTIYKLVVLIIETKQIMAPIRPGILAVYAVVLGLSLSAIQMLPGYVYSSDSSVRVDQYDSYDFAISYSLHEEEAVSMMVPEFCGRDRLWENTHQYWGKNSFKDNSEYAGLVPLMLGILAIFYGRGKVRYFFILMAAATFLYALGDHTPFFKLCYNIIPLVKSTRAPSTIMFLFCFAISVLAGFGIDALRRRNTKRDFRFRAPMNILIFCMPCLLLAGAIAFTFAPNEALHLYLKLVSPLLALNEGKLACAQNNFPEMAAGFRMAFVFAVAVAAIIGLSKHRSLGYALLLLLPLLAMIDGIRYNGKNIRLVDAQSEFALSPIISYIRDHAGEHRAFGYSMNEMALHPYYHGVMSPIGYHGNQLISYSDLLNDHGQFTVNFIRPRFVNLVGARYIMAPANVDFEPLGYGDNLEKVMDHEGIKLMENKDCFPRAYLAGQYRLFSSRDSLYHAIYASSDDLRRVVYLMEESEAEIDSGIFPEDTANITYYGIDSIVISASCSTGKILTISDNYYKDWRVFVDGEEKKPLITYGTFRGVAIEPGDHTVVWRYIPSKYTLGKKITLFAAFYVLIALGIFWWRRHKIRAHPLPVRSYSVFL